VKLSLISHGAAREVTGTCHELKIGDKSIVLDCGMFQGSRREAAEKNATLTFDPKKVDAVILSHAHIDHSGRLPLLYKRGYSGPIFCTYATQDLADVMLQDSAYIQEKDEEFYSRHYPNSMIPSPGALYTQKDASECIKLCVGKNYGEVFQVIPGVTCQFLEAGHILGSAMILLTIDMGGGKTVRFGFSGDVGRSTLPIIRDPVPMPSVDYLICESTYGDRAHDSILTAKDKLRDVIIKTAKRGGKVLIPAFSLERTQEIVYDLHVLWDAKEIPAIPIIIDSPLANRVTEIFRKHPECYDDDMYERFLRKAHSPFQFSLVTYTESVEESKQLNGRPGPMLIMAGSGMCEAGRIRHHLKNELSDPRNTVLAVGFMAENTLGRRIIDPQYTEVKIFDEIIKKKAEIIYINAYSGHADKNDLDRLIQGIPRLKKLFLVHGEERGMFALAERTTIAQPTEIEMPERGKEYEIL
jgi:metallo-beta-lactamase family protein